MTVRLERLETAFDEFSKLDVLLHDEQFEFSGIEDIYLEIKVMIRSEMEAVASLVEVQQNSSNVVGQSEQCKW